jgi:hypothetical protein
VSIPRTSIGKRRRRVGRVAIRSTDSGSKSWGGR